jgi:AraC-like DNA-binding protein
LLNIEPQESYKHEEGFYGPPHYSMRVVKPFIRLLRPYRGFLPRVLDDLEELDIEGRIPVTSVNELLQAAISFTGDVSIGLKAARKVYTGDLGVLDYAMSTAPTVGEAIEMAKRYRRLIDDTLHLYLHVQGEHAMIRVEKDGNLLPRTALDFILGVLYRNHFCRWPRSAGASYQLWFAYSKPELTVEYDLTFPGATIQFLTPFTGFVFTKSDLGTPLRTSDEYLHSVLRKHAELMLAEVPDTKSVAEKVRDLIVTALSNGGPYAVRVSHELDISRRTLIRRLEREGTSFKEILDDVRRQLALGYVGNRDTNFGDVAVLLGFSHLTAFHRAFKRWTNQTPTEYRRSRRR